MSDANALKAEANKAFAAKDYPAATKLYSDAIALDGENHVLYSNRSASKCGQRDFDGALEDAEKCISLSPSFSKGHARKGAALHGLRQYPEAVMAYEAGLQADPSSDVLKKGMAEVEKAMKADTGGMGGMGGMDPMGQMGKMFSDPGLLRKLEANPKTREYMKDAGFMQKVRSLQAGGGFRQDMLADPRMLTVLGVAMGVDIDAMERPEGSDEMPPGYKKAPVESESSQAPAAAAKSSTPSSASQRETAAPAASSSSTADVAAAASNDEKMDVDSEESDDAKAKKEAEAFKAQGNTAYKARQFEEAIGLYQKAWDLYPKDVTFLTNLSAVYFEQGNYQEAITTCEKAVEEGRDLRADYKVMAKAYARIGTSYSKLNDLANAIKFYSKSLTEHRTPDVLTKLREAEKAKAEADKQAYIDPEKAEQAREEGNTSFKAGDFASAVKHYSEAIKRLPSDPKAYNNRAAAYTKLLAMPEALKDANEAIKLDQTFVKAYIRKALVQQAMKEHTGAMETLQKATEVDVEKKHTRELESNMAKIMTEMQSQREGESEEETYARAMRDPEVAQIMADPIMRQMLQDSQQNPRSLQEHMKNPMIAGKIQKLINAGIIRTR